MVTKHEANSIEHEQTRAEAAPSLLLLPDTDRRSWWNPLRWFAPRRARPGLELHSKDAEVERVATQVTVSFGDRGEHILSLSHPSAIYRLCEYITTAIDRRANESELASTRIDRLKRENRDLIKEATELQIKLNALQLKNEQLLLKQLGLDPQPDLQPGSKPAGVVDLLSPGCKAPAADEVQP